MFYSQESHSRVIKKHKSHILIEKSIPPNLSNQIGSLGNVLVSSYSNLQLKISLYPLFYDDDLIFKYNSK